MEHNLHGPGQLEASSPIYRRSASTCVFHFAFLHFELVDKHLAEFLVLQALKSVLCFVESTV